MNKNSWKIIVGICLVIFICLFYFIYKGQANKPGIMVISIGQNNIIVEIADTPAKRTLGLGNRTSMPENHGMLFVFDHPDRYGFWMKDTLIALDMIWIDQNKNIIDIKPDILPASFPSVYYPTSTALYVLELSAEYSQNHGIKIGEKVDF